MPTPHTMGLGQVDSLAVEGLVVGKQILGKRRAGLYEAEISSPIAGKALPCILKLVRSSSAAEEETKIGRSCAGLSECDPDLLKAWEETTEAAKSTHVLAPLKSVKTTTEAAILLPWVGGAIQIPRNGFSLSQALSICRDVAVGLGHCHCRRYLHLDVKPSNIVLDEATGAAMLIDFSLSRILPCNGFTARAMLGGTATHIAPEQTGRMKATVDFRSDLYSLGITLYQLLCGKLPFGLEDKSRGSLLHAQVAMKPLDLPKHIPPVVKAIVLKLMAKEKRKRYSSARSLVDDLEVVIGAQARGLDKMVLDDPPHHVTLQPLRHLYGCSKEVKFVMSAYEDASDGVMVRSRFCTIAGPSGSGKSSLMLAANAALVQRGDYSLLICTGKFLQFDRTPFGAIALCFTSMIKQVRELPKSRRDRVFRILRSDASFLTSAAQLGGLCREPLKLAEELTGQALEPPEAGTPEEEQARFATAFSCIFEIFYKKARMPLVIFLDDLQWADDCSIGFIKSILMVKGTPVLLFGSYRDNEVSAVHPLSVALSHLREQPDMVTVSSVTMQPWSLTCIKEVILGMFGFDRKPNQTERKDLGRGIYSGAELSMLAQFLFNCAAGNPFFTIMLMRGLVDDDVLLYSWEARRWQWNLQQMGSSKYCDNVVEFLLSGMKQLPDTDQRVLLTLAVAGTRMPLGLLCDILPHALPEADKVESADHSAGVNLLWPLIDTGFVTVGLPVSVTSFVRFTHDRIEESAIGLLTPEDRRNTRILVARGMFNALGVGLLAESSSFEKGEDDPLTEDVLAALKLPESRLVMVAVDHLLLVADSISKKSTLSLLARYAALCGNASKASLAYKKAAEYYNAAVGLENRVRDGRLWDTAGPAHQRLWLLHFELARTLRANVEFDEADDILRQCQDQSLSDSDFLLVMFNRAALAGLKEDYNKSIEFGLAAAARLGLDIPRDWDLPQVLEFTQTNILAPMREAKQAGGSMMDVIGEAKEDAELELLDLILDSIIPSAYLGGEVALYALLPAKIVHHSMLGGFSTAGTFNALSILGLCVASIFNMKKEGYELATEGGIKKYNEVMGSKISPLDSCRLNHAAIVQQWGPSNEMALVYFDESFERGVKVGNYGYCTYARAIHLWVCYQAALPLDRILELAKERLPFIRQCNIQDMVVSMYAVTIPARLMVGGAHMPTKQAIAKFEKQVVSRSLFTKAACYVWSMLGYLILNRHADAQRMLKLMDPSLVAGSLGMPQHMAFFWISALVRSQRIHGSNCSRKQKKEDFAELRKAETMLAGCATASPANWRAKHLLVRAHLFRATALSPDHVSPPNSAEVLAAFSEAVRVAEATGMLHVAALGCMAAASVCGQQSPPLSIPRTAFLATAKSYLLQWGALAAANALNIDGKVLTRLSRPSSVDAFSSSQSSKEGSYTDHSDSSMGHDVGAIVEAANIISSKTTLKDVLFAFMRIVERSAGSQTVLLVHRDDDSVAQPVRRRDKQAKSSVVLSGFHVEAERQDGKTKRRIRPLDRHKEPMNLLARCVRSMEVLIISDAQNDERLSGNGSLNDVYFVQNSVRSAMALPLVYQGEILGVVYMENNLSPGVFDRTNSKVVSLLIAQLGISMSNARLFESLTARHAELAKTNKTLAATHKATARFVPEEFLFRLGKPDTTSVQLGDAVEAELTVMFADIRSFTSISEAMNAQGVFEFLNEVLAVLIPCITRNNGTVDKFLGDGTLSLFSRASDAIAAAIELQAAVRKINADRKNSTMSEGDPWPEVHMGVGLNTGSTMLGCLGTESRLDATVVGDTVNVAARVEALTKTLGLDILVTERTMNSAAAEVDSKMLPVCRSVGWVKVQGKAEDLALYQPLESPVTLRKNGEAARAAVMSQLARSRNRFRVACNNFRGGNRELAHEEFQELAAACPEDSAARVWVKWTATESDGSGSVCIGKEPELAL